jgi:ABC-type Fe3+/spermidine/putrescine transport system ATPase subunit
VALARALVKRPKVLLLDEPLSALDAKLRDDMRMELTRLQETVGITFIIVTHDQDEALSMASRIAVIDKGAVQQIATPGIDGSPPRFVADFIGKVNLIDARSWQKAKAITCEARALARPLTRTRPVATLSLLPCGRRLKISKAEPKAAGLIKVQGKVRDVAYYGDTSHIVVSIKGGPDLQVNVQNDSRTGGSGVERGQTIWVSWMPDDSLVLTE